MNIKSNIQKIMEEKGVNASTLADRSGMSRQAVYNMFNRDSDPTFTTLEKFSKALGVSLVDLLTDRTGGENKEEITFSDRLRMVLIAKGIGDSAKVEAMSKREPNLDFFKSFCEFEEFKDIDLRWLITGVGEMYLPIPLSGSAEEKIIGELMKLVTKGKYSN